MPKEAGSLRVLAKTYMSKYLPEGGALTKKNLNINERYLVLN